jgi:NADH:ubiquinone oxidoreductase subunit E
MYNSRPVGCFFVQVCTNVACNLCGADEVVAALCQATGTETGQISSDGLFTIIEAECLGACGFPTAVQINDRYYENVSVEDVPRMVEQLRQRRREGQFERELAAVPEEIRQTVEIAGNGQRALRPGEKH